MKKNRRGLWRGLAGIFAATLMLFTSVAVICEDNKGALDGVLNTHSSVLESKDDNTLYKKKKPSDEVLNADGSLNTQTSFKSR